MSVLRPRAAGQTENGAFARTAMRSVETAASAPMVNRTHRVVRERAKALQTRQRTVRSLWAPLAVSSALLVIICSALWTIFDEYELTPIGIPDSSNQTFVLLLWFLPVSAVLLGMVWFRRAQARGDGEVRR